ncbi:MAG: ATP-binding cassette domain-containing protein [Candidatus Nezhaarchaeales archaeon]
MIEISDLYVKYRWRQEPIIKGVTAKFDSKHLILGPNGSGKTTLFRAIAGLTPISSGKVLIDGIDVSSIYGKPNILAVNLSEVYGILHSSAYDNLRLYMNLVDGDLDYALGLLEQLGVDKMLLKKRKVWELSAGQQKAFSTIAALASRAKHVLLDEPFEQLDPARKLRLIEHLKGYDGVLLLNTHETWLLTALSNWSAVFVFEGKLYGPVPVSELLNASLVMGDEEEALLRFEASGCKYSLVKSDKGESLTKLTTLDKVYELAMGVQQ